MLWLIIRREFVSNILTFRFMVGFMLCLLLFTSSAYVLTKDYEQRLANYSDLVTKHRDELAKVKVYSQLKVNVDRPPKVLSIVSEGFDKKLNNSVTISHRDVPVMSGYTRDNPLLSYFSSIDISFIIQIVLSLLALLFSYNTISGEKERGTLTLTLSNAVKRSTLLLGKYFGPKETMLWHLEQIKFSEPLRLRYVDKVWELYQRYYEELKRT